MGGSLRGGGGFFILCRFVRLCVRLCLQQKVVGMKLLSVVSYLRRSSLCINVNKVLPGIPYRYTIYLGYYIMEVVY